MDMRQVFLAGGFFARLAGKAFAECGGGIPAPGKDHHAAGVAVKPVNRVDFFFTLPGKQDGQAVRSISLRQNACRFEAYEDPFVLEKYLNHKYRPFCYELK